MSSGPVPLNAITSGSFEGSGGGRRRENQELSSGSTGHALVVRRRTARQPPQLVLQSAACLLRHSPRGSAQGLVARAGCGRRTEGAAPEVLVLAAAGAAAGAGAAAAAAGEAASSATFGSAAARAATRARRAGRAARCANAGKAAREAAIIRFTERACVYRAGNGRNSMEESEAGGAHLGPLTLPLWLLRPAPRAAAVVSLHPAFIPSACTHSQLPVAPETPLFAAHARFRVLNLLASLPGEPAGIPAPRLPLLCLQTPNSLQSRALFHDAKRSVRSAAQRRSKGRTVTGAAGVPPRLA